MIIILQNTIIYDFQTLFKGKKFGMYGDCWDGRRGVPFLGFGYLYQDVWIYKPFC